MPLDATMIASLSAVTVACVTGFFTWMLHRRTPQKELNESFQLIVEQLQEERIALRQANVEFLNEISLLRSNVRRLERRIGTLERLLIEHGIEFDEVHLDHHGPTP